MGICYVPITGNIIVHKVNIVLTLIWGRCISRCQVKIKLSSTRQVCILKLKVRNNQYLQIVAHVTGTAASTRGIKIEKTVLPLTNRKFEMEDRNKQKVKINF